MSKTAHAATYLAIWTTKETKPFVIFRVIRHLSSEWPCYCWKKAAARENRCVDSASGTVSAAMLPRGFIPFQQEHQGPRQNRIQLHIKTDFLFYFFQDGQLRGTILISTEMHPAGKQNYLVWAEEWLCLLQDIFHFYLRQRWWRRAEGISLFFAKNILPTMRVFQ